MLWIAGGAALLPVGAAIDDDTMNDTESLLRPQDSAAERPHEPETHR